MKTFAVLSVAAVLLVAFVPGTVVAKEQASHVDAMPFPGLTLNMTGGMFYNLTYMGLLLKTPNGSYLADFVHGKWVFNSSSNGIYTYASDIMFTPYNSNSHFANAASPLTQGGSNGTSGNGGSHGGSGGSGNSNGTSGNGGSHGGSQGNGGNSSSNASSGHPNGNQNIIPRAMVLIELQTLNYSLSNLTMENTSTNVTNYTFPQYSTLEITLTITFQTPVNGPGDLELIQLIKSSNYSGSSAGYYFGRIVHGNSSGDHGGDQGVQIPTGYNNSGNGTVNAFYWWNNTFYLNGVGNNLTSAVVQQDGGVYVVFDFAFNNSTSLKSLYQDPFFGIPGTSIFKNPIIKKEITTIVNYVVVHIEYFVTGIATGGLFMGFSYSVYRKRRV